MPLKMKKPIPTFSISMITLRFLSCLVNGEIGGSTNTNDLKFLNISSEFARWWQDLWPCPSYFSEHSSCPSLENKISSYRDQTFRCRCDTACLKYGDCCMSKQKGRRKIPMESYFFSCERLLNTNESIRMITKCPLEYDLDENKKLCEEQNESTPTVAELDVPVADLRNGDIYRNIYCARCHSIPVADIHMNYSVNCSFNTDLEEESDFIKRSVYERGKYILKDLDPMNHWRYCNLTVPEFHPDKITKLVPQVRFCSRGPREECLIDFENEENRINYHLCRSYLQPVYYESGHNDEISHELFRNPHCAKCAYYPNNTILRGDLQCERRHTWYPFKPMKPKTISSALSKDIFYPNVKWRESIDLSKIFPDVSSQNTACGVNQKYNPFLQKCDCYPGYRLNYGECERIEIRYEYEQPAAQSPRLWKRLWWAVIAFIGFIVKVVWGAMRSAETESSAPADSDSVPVDEV